jgi:hypothetical protein
MGDRSLTTLIVFPTDKAKSGARNDSLAQLNNEYLPVPMSVDKVLGGFLLLISDVRLRVLAVVLMLLVWIDADGLWWNWLALLI